MQSNANVYTYTNYQSLVFKIYVQFLSGGFLKIFFTKSSKIVTNNLRFEFDLRLIRVLIKPNDKRDAICYHMHSFFRVGTVDYKQMYLQNLSNLQKVTKGFFNFLLQNWLLSSLYWQDLDFLNFYTMTLQCSRSMWEIP